MDRGAQADPGTPSSDDSTPSGWAGGMSGSGIAAGCAAAAAAAEPGTSWEPDPWVCEDVPPEPPFGWVTEGGARLGSSFQEAGFGPCVLGDAHAVATRTIQARRTPRCI